MAKRSLMQPWLLTFGGRNASGGMAVGAKLIVYPARGVLWVPGQPMPADVAAFGKRVAREQLPADVRDDVSVLAVSSLPGIGLVEGPDGRRYRVTIAVDPVG